MTPGLSPFGTAEPVRFDTREPVGLLACAGRFPIVFAEKARECGLPVVCVGVKTMADPALAKICPQFTWLNRASLGGGGDPGVPSRGGVRRLHDGREVREARPVSPAAAGCTFVPDWRMLRFWFFRRRSAATTTTRSLLGLDRRVPNVGNGVRSGPGSLPGVTCEEKACSPVGSPRTTAEANGTSALAGTCPAKWADWTSGRAWMVREPRRAGSRGD